MQAVREESKSTKGEIQDLVVCPLKKFVDGRGWLAEFFRHDEIKTDLFCFVGAGNFKMRMWDNRADSPTYRNMMTLFVGADNPQAVIVPVGVAHAYKKVSVTEKGVVINCPNRLFMGEGKREAIDEIRHEDDLETIFRIDD